MGPIKQIFDAPRDQLRLLIYKTNAVESLVKMLFLAIRDVSKK
jgi:hypothetical protein